MTSTPPPRLDAKRDLPAYRARHGRFDLVDVPPMRFLQVDGAGDPNTSPAYEAALEALYPFAYRLKFRSKRELGRDYVVPPLEGLWWAGDMDAFTSRRDKDRWQWRMMLMTPPWLTGEDVEAVRGDLLARLGGTDGARAAFRRAADLAENGVERAHLLRRADELE